MRTGSLTGPHGPAGSSETSVSVTPPASISPGVGRYVALSAARPGLNVPAPPVHEPLVAPPPTPPASCTSGLLAHTTGSRPAFAVAAGLIVMRIGSFAGPQGPAGSAVTSVSVTPPAAISAAVGVYVASSAERPGLNAPAPPVHEPLVAPPPTPPASCTCGLLAQTTWSRPASAVADGLIVIRIGSLAGPHGPAGSFVSSVSVTPPAAISSGVGRYVALSAARPGLNDARAAAPRTARRAAAHPAGELHQRAARAHQLVEARVGGRDRVDRDPHRVARRGTRPDGGNDVEGEGQAARRDLGGGRRVERVRVAASGAERPGAAGSSCRRRSWRRPRAAPAGCSRTPAGRRPRRRGRAR